jgi:hypothetical protein
MAFCEKAMNAANGSFRGVVRLLDEGSLLGRSTWPSGSLRRRFRYLT